MQIKPHKKKKKKKIELKNTNEKLKFRENRERPDFRIDADVTD